MATTGRKAKPRGIFEAADPKTLALTVGVNRTAANHLDAVEPYWVRNALMLEREKERIRQENGFTAPLPEPVIPPRARPPVPVADPAAEDAKDAAPAGKKARKKADFYAAYDAKGRTLAPPAPYTVEQLRYDADRDGSHRRTLSRNIERAGFAKPKNVCAHHIVAHREPEADLARERLYAWGIAINDADNGVFLPRFEDQRKRMREFPDATYHGAIHTVVYYARVYQRLLLADDHDSESGRAQLRRMKGDMQAGKFPYREEA